MMSDKVDPMLHSDQQLESGSPPSLAPQVGKRELTDDEKIDAGRRPDSGNIPRGVPGVSEIKGVAYVWYP